MTLNRIASKIARRRHVTKCPRVSDYQSLFVASRCKQQRTAADVHHNLPTSLHIKQDGSVSSYGCIDGSRCRRSLLSWSREPTWDAVVELQGGVVRPALRDVRQRIERLLNRHEHLAIRVVERRIPVTFPTTTRADWTSTCRQQHQEQASSGKRAR